MQKHGTLASINFEFVVLGHLELDEYFPATRDHEDGRLEEQGALPSQILEEFCYHSTALDANSCKLTSLRMDFWKMWLNKPLRGLIDKSPAPRFSLDPATAHAGLPEIQDGHLAAGLAAGPIMSLRFTSNLM